MYDKAYKYNYSCKQTLQVDFEDAVDGMQPPPRRASTNGVGNSHRNSPDDPHSPPHDDKTVIRGGSDDLMSMYETEEERRARLAAAAPPAQSVSGWTLLTQIQHNLMHVTGQKRDGSSTSAVGKCMDVTHTNSAQPNASYRAKKGLQRRQKTIPLHRDAEKPQTRLQVMTTSDPQSVPELDATPKTNDDKVVSGIGWVLDSGREGPQCSATSTVYIHEIYRNL